MEPQTPTQIPSKDYPILATIVILLIVFGIGAIAFVAYQGYRSKQLVLNTPIPIATLPPTPSITSTPDPGLKKSDSQAPSSGACNDILTGNILTITLNTDAPVPKCTKVSANQQLKLVNSTGKDITITLGKYTNTPIPKGETYVFTDTFGAFLQKGVHVITISAYSSSNPEIWLQ